MEVKTLRTKSKVPGQSSILIEMRDTNAHYADSRVFEVAYVKLTRIAGQGYVLTHTAWDIGHSGLPNFEKRFEFPLDQHDAAVAALKARADQHLHEANQITQTITEEM